MKLRIREYLRSPLGIWYRICLECASALKKDDDVKETLPPSRDVEDSNRIVSTYWELDREIKKDAVVYTCITNGYDDIAKIAVPSFVNYKWDYVCFTDSVDHIKSGCIGVWKIRPLAFAESDGTRNNRWHKFHPEVLFPDYSESIYIDANVDVLTSWIFEEAFRRNARLMLPLHPIRKCIFQEYKTIMAQFMDDPQLLLAERRLIAKSGMPRNYGMTENNVIYRKHNDPLIMEMMAECWDMLVRYSKRDQLCMSWVLWKHGIRIDDIAFPNARHDIKNFCVFGHAGC